MSSLTVIKARWVPKLLVSPYFVIMTDKGAVIALDGVNPHSFEDMAALNAQRNELKLFQEQLAQLVKDHDRAATKLTKDGNAKTVKKYPADYREKQARHQQADRDSVRAVTKKAGSKKTIKVTEPKN